MNDYAHRKKVAWVALAIGVGGTLAFVLLGVREHFPGWSDILFYIWPINSITISAIAAVLLKKYYREEPETFAGHWHLSITDLIAISYFAALAMSFWHAAWPVTLAYNGLPVSLILAAAFTACILVSTRRGFDNSFLKWSDALSLLFRALGWMAIGAIAAFWLLILFFDHDPRGSFNFLASILLFVSHFDDDPPNWILYPLRIGWICLPLGFTLKILLRFLVSRQNRSR